MMNTDVKNIEFVHLSLFCFFVNAALPEGGQCYKRIENFRQCVVVSRGFMFARDKLSSLPNM